MTSPDLFWAVFAAVLAANLLTVAFVWCCVQIGKRERASDPPGVYLAGFLLVFGFLAGGFYIAMGGQ